jgi:hypothetical protein
MLRLDETVVVAEGEALRVRERLLNLVVSLSKRMFLSLPE